MSSGGFGRIELIVLVVDTDIVKGDSVKRSSLQRGSHSSEIELFRKSCVLGGDRLIRKDNNIRRNRSLSFLESSRVQ